MPMCGPDGHYLPILYIRSCLHNKGQWVLLSCCGQLKTARRSLWMFFLQRLRSCARQLFLCHLEADSPVLAPRALVMVTLMQPRDLEMKQTLFIALFQPDPQCKLPDYRSFMAVLCYCRSRTFLLQTFQNTEIQHLQCINVYKEIVNCPTRWNIDHPVSAPK